jgi:hypothetical protein
MFKQVFFVSCFIGIHIFAQDHSSPLDDFMTKEKQKQIGVDQLSTDQQKQLAKWLSERIETNIPKSRKKEKDAELTLSENRLNGKILLLSDGTKWQIAPDDLDRSSLWLTPFPVRVERNDQNAAYPYKIINNYTGSSVKAKKVEKGENL